MSPPSEREQAFITYLWGLADEGNPNGRAALAALRRGLGKAPGDVAEMYPYVVPFLPEHSGWVVDRYFLIASLFATHPETWVGEDDRATNFGASLRWAEGESGGIERRFVALLNAGRDELPDHLRHAVALCRSAEPPVPINWALLLRDLADWTREDRRVQLRWATSFWRRPRAEEGEDAAVPAAG